MPPASEDSSAETPASLPPQLAGESVDSPTGTLTKETSGHGSETPASGVAETPACDDDPAVSMREHPTDTQSAPSDLPKDDVTPSPAAEPQTRATPTVSLTPATEDDTADLAELSLERAQDDQAPYDGPGHAGSRNQLQEATAEPGLGLDTPADEATDVASIALAVLSEDSIEETTAAPIAELDFKPIRQTRLTHLRVDSVPPQRYNIDDAENDDSLADAHHAHLSPTIEEEESSVRNEAEHFQRYADEHLFYGAGHAMERIASHMSGVSEANRSRQSFVDVQLEPAGDLGSSIALPSSPFATTFEGRSSEQIRSDSISSANIQRVEEPRSSLGQADTREASASAGPSIFRRSSQLFDTPPLSPSIDKPLPGKPAEGRYRGRMSVASSRAASPEPAGGERRSASRSRRTSRYDGMTSNPGTPPRTRGHGKTSSVSSTGSSAGAVLAGRIAGALQAEQERMTPSRLPSIVTEANTPPSGTEGVDETGKATSGVTVVVADENGQAAESTPTDASKASVEEGRINGQSRPQVRSASFKMAAGLDEECEAEDPSSVNHASGKARKGSSGSPSVPPRSTSVPHALSPSTATTTLSPSPGLSDKADLPDDKQSRRRRSSAANAEPIESRTRMTTLPPKDKSEEIKHRVDFEKMMVMHKELERKRHEQEEERRRKKEEERRASLVRWEKEILPSWTRARKDDGLRELWWQGVPPSIRGRVWALAIGNAMMLPRNLLEQAEKRIAPPAPAGELQERIDDQGRRAIPLAVMEAIDDDIQDTLPSLKLFQKDTGPLYDDLVRICHAFVLVRMEQVDEMTAAGNADRSAARMQTDAAATRSPTQPSTGGTLGEADEYTQRGIELYQRGLSVLAAVLLVNLPATTAFICLLNLINSKAWLKALYSLSPTLACATASPQLKGKGGSKHDDGLSPKEKGIRGFERVFETLLADQMPKVYANLLAQRVEIHAECVRDWVGQLWGSWLDVDTVMRLWDVVLLDESDALIYRACLALVQTLESRLYVPDGAELRSVLRGTNRAALSLWRRDKELSGQLSVHLDAAGTGTGAAGRRRSSAAVSSSSISNADGGGGGSTADGEGEEKEGEVEEGGRVRRESVPPSMVEVVPKDYVYEQYGIREETVFDALEAQTAWWKPATLSRLLDRELDDA